MANEAKPKTVMVLSNMPRVDTIGVGYSATAGGAGTKARTIRLLPGVNEVHAESWEEAKKLKVVRHHLEMGNFKELSSAKRQGLADMDVKGAIEVVEKTLDRELLKTWLGLEKRGAVASAIEQQIDEITFKPERDAAGKDDGMDLQPRAAASGLDGAEVAAQVNLDQPLEPIDRDRPEAKDVSKSPVEPPAALTQQLRDVQAPKAGKSRK